MTDRLLSQEEATDLCWVMSDARGRRVMRYLMVKTGINLSVFRPRPNVLPEERVTFNGAQQDFGRRLQAVLLEADPLKFHAMNGEAAAKKLLERDSGGPEIKPHESEREFEEAQESE